MVATTIKLLNENVGRLFCWVITMPKLAIYVLLGLFGLILVSCQSSQRVPVPTGNAPFANIKIEGSWHRATNQKCSFWSRYSNAVETSLWRGQCAGGRAEGHGKAVYRYYVGADVLEDVYIGRMRDGRMHGTGTYYWSNGARYRGDWRDSCAHGHGVFVWPTGERYVGEWVNCRQHGLGKFWSKNRYYEGQWKNGYPLERPDDPERRYRKKKMNPKVEKVASAKFGRTI